MAERPNVLLMMCDQQRFDTIAALGNAHIYTPNMDRLVRRGISFTQGYSTCPVCVAARVTIRTGCEPPTTRAFTNRRFDAAPGQAPTIEDRCGEYLAKRMRRLGYRTFGVGKFHTKPWNLDVGYDVQLHSEELYGTPQQRSGDGFAGWLQREHPEYDYVETLMGERTEMYYMPQASPLPPECTVESWAADRAVELIDAGDGRPYFGFVSFVGPHPPFAPPVPFNRMYDPDRMPNPIRGEIDTDHMDQEIPSMNRMIWADDISDERARVLKARYYGEISFIDDCMGRILDAVEARDDADNTLIAFFADHGDHMGDHHAWQKETYFDAACHVPFLVSWPARLPADQRRDDLVCLTDLFAIATGAAGEIDTREGIDVLGVVDGAVAPRETLFACYALPGTHDFKVMIRTPRWKYIYLANGGQEQLFDMPADPHELHNVAGDNADVAAGLRAVATDACNVPGAADAVENGKLKALPYTPADLSKRIYQFDTSRGVNGFPDKPEDVILEWKRGRD